MWVDDFYAQVFKTVKALTPFLRIPIISKPEDEISPKRFNFADRYPPMSECFSQGMMGNCGESCHVRTAGKCQEDICE